MKHVQIKSYILYQKVKYTNRSSCGDVNTKIHFGLERLYNFELMVVVALESELQSNIAVNLKVNAEAKRELP